MSLPIQPVLFPTPAAESHENTNIKNKNIAKNNRATLEWRRSMMRHFRSMNSMMGSKTSWSISLVICRTFLAVSMAGKWVRTVAFSLA